ncbi:MAG TPA: 2'-5' RNA ligase family protein [Bryobacteraceae bacterium]|jgi:2'-5' RNA ligase|nr:2'-5' RNA ligase family protein [Bryobacteraceae bacterium]
MFPSFEDSEHGWFALVWYVPDPIGSAIGNLARELPSANRPKPHITLLPPRPLRRSFEEISTQVRSILEQIVGFDIDLANVCRFDGTNVLYLDVAEGNEMLHRLHDLLNQGDLAFSEPFEFRPHLTLTDPLPESEVRTVQARAEALWNALLGARRFRIDEIVFLYLAPGNAERQWQRSWSVALRRSSPAQMGT